MANTVRNKGPNTDEIATTVRETGPRSLPAVVEAVTPISAVWAPPDGHPVVSVGSAAAIAGSGPERFRTIKANGRALLDNIESEGLPRPARPRLFGGFSFFDSSILDAPWRDFPPARFVLPAVQITLGTERTWVAGFGEGGDDDHVSRIVASLEAAEAVRQGESVTPTEESRQLSSSFDPSGLRTDRDAWIDRVRSIQQAIETTDLQKAVLAAAFELPVDRSLSLGTILRRLEDRYPDCYRFGFTGRKKGRRSTPRSTFFGASPETLVAKRGQAIETEALAGTVERGDSTGEDAGQKDRLLGDGTLQTEHRLVADRIVDQLKRFGAEVTVKDRSVRTLANVHHLQTPISATVPAETHVLDLVELLHPTPAVGGLPPDTARATIADLESTVRGWYGAPVGWFDASGDGTFAVGIRSALASGTRATLFAGNGIVAGSDPGTEYEELAAKFEPIREVLS